MSTSKSLFYFLPAILWAILIYALSSNAPMEDNPFDWMDFVGIDKLGHLVFYCIFCMLVMWGLSKTSWRKSSALIALSIVTIYGIIMEILQYYFYEGRQMDFADVVANIVGATLGYFLFRTFLHKI